MLLLLLSLLLRRMLAWLWASEGRGPLLRLVMILLPLVLVMALMLRPGRSRL